MSRLEWVIRGACRMLAATSSRRIRLAPHIARACIWTVRAVHHLEALARPGVKSARQDLFLPPLPAHRAPAPQRRRQPGGQAPLAVVRTVFLHGVLSRSA